MTFCDITQLQLGDIRSRTALRPIAREQKYLMDQKKYPQAISNVSYVNKLQRDLSSPNSWSSEHFMKFNTNKCIRFVITKKINFLHYIAWMGRNLQTYSWKKDNHTKEKIMALGHVQRHATKFILKSDLTYPERLAKLRFLPLEFIWKVLGLSSVLF